MKKKLSKKIQSRCDQLYKVGLEMFLKNGYKKTSLAAIVKEAGGSLSTIYQHFGNKETFFEAVVFKGVEEFYEKLENRLKQEKDQSLENFLYKFGVEYINIFVNEEAIAIGRILYSEGFIDNRKIANNFKIRIHKILNKIFIDYFEENNIKQYLKSDDYETIILQYCLLLREPQHTDSIFGNKTYKLTKKQREIKVKKTIDFFLNGYYKKS